MLIKNVEVSNFHNAIKGMRFPKKSENLSDSYFETNLFKKDAFILGEKDKELAIKLVFAGTDHSKFLRQIFVSAEITAPLYWWKEFDQYKIGTTTNSESTMHKLTSTPITMENFSFEDIPGRNDEVEKIVNYLEELRQEFIETKNKETWRLLVQLLPSAWRQKRMWTGSYANLINIEFARRNHKLKEWQYFRETMLRECPHLGIFIAAKERNNGK